MSNFTPTTKTALEELKRELKLRENFYPKWISFGKITEDQAGKNIKNLLFAIKKLEQLLNSEESQLSLFPEMEKSEVEQSMKIQSPLQ